MIQDKELVPVTKLGHLVKDVSTKSLEKICLFFLPIKASEIMEYVSGDVPQGQGYNDHVGAEADLNWPVDQVQGISRQEQQWPCQSLCSVFQGDSHHYPRGHHLGQPFHCSHRERLLGNKIGKLHSVLAR
jgi:hypothetical protein